jgi:hypothetical protein
MLELVARIAGDEVFHAARASVRPSADAWRVSGILHPSSEASATKYHLLAIAVHDLVTVDFEIT